MTQIVPISLDWLPQQHREGDSLYVRKLPTLVVAVAGETSEPNQLTLSLTPYEEDRIVHILNEAVYRVLSDKHRQTSDDWEVVPIISPYASPL